MRNCIIVNSKIALMKLNKILEKQSENKVYDVYNHMLYFLIKKVYSIDNKTNVCYNFEKDVLI